ncbi:MAG: hypothetical protein K5930_02120 [Treponemataceae bacterium]|nr:hypothetical protein [Treponemataceae bacterium]
MNSHSYPSLKEYKAIKTYLFVIFNRKTFWPFIKCFHTALKKFFIPQFSVKAGFRKTPVVQVDNVLDRTIPFSPRYISIYLDFIHSMARPLSFCISKFNRKQSSEIAVKIINELRNCYETAYDIYAFRMSTTNRPNYRKDRHFRMLHALDPHFMCVPSLHVSLMIMSWILYREIFNSYLEDEKESKFYTQEIFKSAITITETVLYVKQHSVNCIPSAIYMMTEILKGRFILTDAVYFIDNLFSENKEMSDGVKQSIHSYIQILFERFVLENCSEEDWTVPIKRWLTTYKTT